MPNKKGRQVPYQPLSNMQLLAAAFQGNGRVVLAIVCFLSLTASLCVLWVIPFPEFKFLGTYATYINWASFGIAAMVYYYYSCNKTLSYYMLLLTMASSYLVTKVVGVGGANAAIIVAAFALVAIGGLWFAWFRFNQKQGMPSLLHALVNGWQVVFNKYCTGNAL